jgi:serine protease Do
VIAASVSLDAVQGKWKFPLKSHVWLIDAITNNSGAAGGLLTDSDGQPVGLIGREIRHATSGTWVNYAVPLKTLQPAVEAMLKGQRLTPAAPTTVAEPLLSARDLTGRFGLTLIPAVLERTPAWIDSVVPGTAAAQAGFRRGDLIVLVGDAVITSESDARRRLAEYRAGQKAAITVSRDEQLLELSLLVPAATTTGR